VTEDSSPTTSDDAPPASAAPDTLVAIDKAEVNPLAQFFNPAITAVIGLLATIVSFLGVRGTEDDAIGLRFNNQAQLIRISIVARIHAYEQVLRGGIGLFRASDSVKRDEWQAYFTGLDIDRHYPGIQGIGFAQILTPDEIEPFAGSIRAEGFPDFKVWPESDREMRSAIKFLEPFDERNQRAFGYDMLTEPTRYTAASQAIDTGLATMTGKVTLVQETDADVQAGFLTYLPLYRKGAPLTTTEQRRAAAFGFVYSPFRMNNFMQGLLNLETSEQFKLEIFDGNASTETALMYRSSTLESLPQLRSTPLQQSFLLDLSNHRWTMVVTARPEFRNASDHSSSHIILASGLLLTLLAVIIHRTLRSTESKALDLATRMTSELRSSEQQVIELVSTLEKRVTERTESLVAINKELEAFSYSVSHDLRAPLRSVHGFATALSEDYSDKLDATGIGYLKRVTGAADRMDRLIDDLLGLSRVSRAPLNREPVDVSKIAAVVLEGLDRDTHEHPVKWIIQPGMVTYGDRAMVESVLQNLLENAWKYSSKNPQPMIEVTLSEEEQVSYFLVKDNGIGFDQKYAEKVFQPFQRLHDDSVYEGSGIGLSTVRRIVQRHGGKIWIETTVAVGTKVYFNFGNNPQK